MFPLLKQRQPLKIQIRQLLSKLRNILLTLNLFARRNSDDSEVREQILTTPFYIGCLFAFTLILASVTTLEQRIQRITVFMPTIDEFEDLFQIEKLSYSCPCSEIAIERSKFITLIPSFHPICSSELLSSDWAESMTYSSFSRDVYHYLDIHSYGVYVFEITLSFCLLANETTIDAITTFLSTDFVTTQVLSRQQFGEQTRPLISDFQLDLENTFKQQLNIADKTNQGNQVLTNRGSNFFMDGLFDSNGHLISVRIYTGAVLFRNDSPPLCSCLLNICRQRIGVYDGLMINRNVTLAVEVPGMYSACYPLDAFRISTFECWFNKSCMDLVWNTMDNVPIEPYFNPLNSSNLIRFSSNTTMGDIIDNMMIDAWTNLTHYEKYYNICRPLTCTYTSYHRFDWVYTITILTSVFGGLSVSLRIACPIIIKLYFRCRRKRSVSTESKSFNT